MNPWNYDAWFRVEFVAYLALLGVQLILLGVALAGLAVAAKKRERRSRG